MVLLLFSFTCILLCVVAASSRAALIATPAHVKQQRCRRLSGEGGNIGEEHWTFVESPEGQCVLATRHGKV